MCPLDEWGTATEPGMNAWLPVDMLDYKDESTPFEMVVRTHPGQVRAKNEDAVFADPELGLAILADGMGGYNAGEVASSLATKQLSRNIAEFINSASVRDGMPLSGEELHERMLDEVAAANALVFETARSDPRCAGMGTTLVMVLFHLGRMHVAHLGDSRLYRLRANRFEQVTRDHSLLQDQIDAGLISEEEARYAENRNLVTRALGVEPSVEAEVREYDVHAGDLLLLCSDGLNDMVEDREIAQTLIALSENLPLAADQLIEMANEKGGHDNISVILIKVQGETPVPKGWWQKLLGQV